MHVSEMMNQHVTTISPDAGFETLLCKLACLPSRALYVVDNDRRLLGIITSYDLLKLMCPFYLDSNLAKLVVDDLSLVRHAFADNTDKRAHQIMTRDFTPLRTTDTFVAADALIREKGVNTLPVVDGYGRLVGEITRKDVLRYLVLECCRCSCEPGEE